MQLLEDKEMAAQLRKPHGEFALTVGEFMAKANENLYLEFCKSYSPVAKTNFLEIGPGNGTHISKIVSLNNDLNFTAIDLSDEMVKAAQVQNSTLIESGRVQIGAGNCRKMNFEPASFDHILGINTIYFWDPVEIYLTEIRRVMKKGAQLCLGYRTRSSMSELPFTKFGFTLYEPEELERNLTQVGFDTVSSRVFEEQFTGPDGRKHRLDGVFTLASHL